MSAAPGCGARSPPSARTRTQHAEHLAQVVHRLRGRSRRSAAAVARTCAGRRVAADLEAAGVQGDQRHLVGEHVVHLAGDARPLAEPGLLGAQLPLGLGRAARSRSDATRSRGPRCTRPAATQNPASKHAGEQRPRPSRSPGCTGAVTDGDASSADTDEAPARRARGRATDASENSPMPSATRRAGGRRTPAGRRRSRRPAPAAATTSANALTRSRRRSPAGRSPAPSSRRHTVQPDRRQRRQRHDERRRRARGGRGAPTASSTGPA